MLPLLHPLLKGHLWGDVGMATAGRHLPEPGFQCFTLNVWSPAGLRNLLVRFEQNSVSWGLRAGGEIVRNYKKLPNDSRVWLEAGRKAGCCTK